MALAQSLPTFSSRTFSQIPPPLPLRICFPLPSRQQQQISSIFGRNCRRAGEAKAEERRFTASDLFAEAAEEGDARMRKVQRLGSLLVLPGLVAPGAMVESPLWSDLVAAVLTMGGALGMLKVFDELAEHNVMDKKLSRKVVHISVGLAFMLAWPLFSDSRLCPVLAALAPAGNAVRMLLLGSGVWENEALVKAMSREGDRRELLKGPFYYALTISIVTACFWRTSPVGVVALANLCAGDGFADIAGRRLGSAAKLPYNPSKSYAGSIAMLVMGTLVSILYLWLFASLGYFSFTWTLALKAALVALAASVVESLPISTCLDDNLTVPLSSILAGLLLFDS